ncbi:hypothetical protein [Vibrio breoganii]|uniref:hypothetical protein n=1 Tax=Vibrio breoganii TaxID=553239 RepID=UPI0021C31A25|nr:hypothetical protein [Vibrio breoganii]MDN3714990.1 hypothetical protein [Vibrio breoganii]
MSYSTLVLYKKDGFGTFTFQDSVEDSLETCEALFNDSDTCWHDDVQSSFVLYLINSNNRVIASKQLTATQNPTVGYF